MPVSIKCVCNFLEDHRWHYEWATLDPEAQVNKQVTFSITPAQFVIIVKYLEGILADPAKSRPRPNLDAIQLRLRYRRNADMFELRLAAETGALKTMVDRPQLIRILDYHQACLQSYAIAVYEGRSPIPEGYPVGYPEPHWKMDE